MDAALRGWGESLTALTDDQKAQADRLLLTYPEMSSSLAARINPETYARHSQEMQAERDAWDAKLEAVGAALTDRLRYAVQR